MSPEETLKQRGNVHGDFTENAFIADNLVRVMQASRNWELISPIARIALTYIAGKISRILAGDASFADHWHDIQGYAKCVEDRLPKPETLKDEKTIVQIAIAGLTDLSRLGGGNSEGNQMAKDILRQMKQGQKPFHCANGHQWHDTAPCPECAKAGLI